MLDRFCGASGLKINFVKSKTMASWYLGEALEERIVVVTFIPFTSNIGKCVGFPTLHGHVIKEAFAFIVIEWTQAYCLGRVTW